MKKRYQCFKKKYHRNLENRKKYESSGIDGDGGWVGGFDILILSFIPNPYGSVLHLSPEVGALEINEISEM